MSPARPLLAALALAAIASPAVADDGGVRGRVVDATTGDPIAGATVAADGEHDAITDADGGFVLTGVAPGAVDLVAYADGYAPIALAVSSSDRDVATIELATDGDGEVIVVEDAAAASSAPAVPAYGLDRAALRAVPGAGNDVLRAVQTLPGVARMPYGLGGLVLRGTSPRDSNVYLDGVEIPVAFHFAAVSSIFPSALLEELTVIPGGGDAAYGRSVGGVVDMRSRAPRGDRFRVGGEIGLMDGQVSAEGPTPGGGAFVAAVRRSYIDAVLGSVDAGRDMLLPRYYDGQLRWDQTVAGGTLTAQTYFSDDRLVTGTSLLHSRFARASLRYRREIGRLTSTTTAWAGRDQLVFSGQFTDGTASDLGRDTWPGGVRSDLVRTTDWGHLAGGLDVQGAQVASARDVLLPGGLSDQVAARRSYIDAAAWAEARWRIADGRLTLEPGARLDHTDLGDDWTFDPRLLVSHELAPWLTLRETLGLHHQPPSPSDLELASKMERRATSAVHASVGADVTLPAQVRVSVTGFQVALDGVAISNPDRGPQIRFESTSGSGVGALARELVDDQLSTYVFQDSVGRGRTRGAELSVVQRTDRWLGWIAYTLSRAERTGDPARQPGWRRYDFDQTHNLTAVGSLRLGRWQLGARLRYASGNPRPVMSEGVDERAGAADQRLPDFVSLDLRADHTWTRSWGTVGVFVDVQNVTAADNVEDVMVDAGETRQVRGLPTFPSFGLSYAPAH
jgi:hypothetical protein